MKLLAILIGGMGGLVMAAGIEHNDLGLMWCSFVLAVIAGSLI